MRGKTAILPRATMRVPDKPGKPRRDGGDAHPAPLSPVHPLRRAPPCLTMPRRTTLQRASGTLPLAIRLARDENETLRLAALLRHVEPISGLQGPVKCT